MTQAKKKIVIPVVIVLVLAALVGVVILTRPKDNGNKIETLDDLEGKKIAVLTGAVFDKIAEEYIKNPQLYYSESEADSATLLGNGKVDAWIGDEPILRCTFSKYPHFRSITQLTNDSYAYIFNKSSDKAAKICAQMNEFLAQIKEDGTLAEIDAKWFAEENDAQKVDYPTKEEAVNGTLYFGTATVTGAPFSYVKNGEYVGYDIDIAARFCRAYGYGLVVQDYDFPGLLAAIQSGKDGIDFGGACITVTEERAQKILFSDANYVGGIVVLVNDAVASAQRKTIGDFFREQIANFKATFITENRWQLFAKGVGNTMLITVLSIVFGTLLGFGLFWLSHETGKGVNAVISFFSKLVEGMPVVVLLMVMYYVVFGNSTLSNVAVCVVSFSVVFGSAVLNVLSRSADTVSYAQTEASLALGFTRFQTFFKVILPQALRQFLPAYRSEIVTLMKATAVVGYLAVQDLTKMSDVVRSRTFEAFFPLLATAIIYFVLEYILIAIVKAIQIKTNPKRRTKEQILKGIDVK